MRKGQKVRVKSTNKIGVIADTEFFHWGGRKHMRYEVKFEGQKNTCWYPKENLTTDMIEKTDVVFRGENGTLLFTMTHNHLKKDGFHVELTGIPENLNEHKGIHSHLALAFFKMLSNNS